MAPRGNEWTGLDTPAGFERCVRGSVRELYGYLALLTGRDRARTEQMVTDVYRSLFRAAASGQLDVVRLGALRSAARRLWLERNDAELARPARLSPGPVKSIAELSVIERAVVVLRHVNGMSDDRTGVELGRPAGEVAAVAEHAVRRLRGTTASTSETTGAWLRAYFDASVAPRSGLVDRIVSELGPSDDTPAPEAGVDEPTAPMPVVVPTESGEPVEPAATTDPAVDEPTAPMPAVTPEDRRDDPAAPGRIDDGVGPTGAAIGPDGQVDGEVDGEVDDDAPTSEVPAASDGEPSWAAPPDDDQTLDVPDAKDATDVTDMTTRASLASGDDPASAATSELPVTRDPDPTRAVDVEGPVGPGVPATRRWWPVVLVAVLALGLIALWWLFGRDDDTGSIASDLSVPEEPTPASADEITDASAPTTDGTAATTVAATSPSTVPSISPSTAPSTVATTDPGAAAGPVILDESSARFDPPCAGWYAVPTPASPPLPATFGPLGAEPAVTVEIPVVTDGAVTSAIVEPAGDGLLLGVVQSGADDTAATVLARVGIDGVVHWVRCYDEELIVTGEPNADVDAAVGRLVDGQLGWYTVSMADGDVSTDVDPVTGLALDVLHARGRVTVPGATAQWVDGVLTGFDADGNVTWTDPDAETRAGDGFQLLVGDDLAVAFVCDDGTCQTGRLRGYDLASGERRWERAGFAYAAVAADGHALIGSPTGWDVVTTDGETVPGQTWADPLRFATPCCLEGPTPFTERFGGLVVTAREGAVDLWLPADATDGTTVVDLAPPD